MPPRGMIGADVRRTLPHLRPGPPTPKRRRSSAPFWAGVLIFAVPTIIATPIDDATNGTIGVLVFIAVFALELAIIKRIGD